MKRKALDKLESIAKKSTKTKITDLPPEIVEKIAGYGDSKKVQFRSNTLFKSIFNKKPFADIESLPVELVRKIATESIRDSGYSGGPNLGAGNDLYEAVFNKRPFKVKKSVTDFYYNSVGNSIDSTLRDYGAKLAKQMGIRVIARNQVYDESFFPKRTIWLPDITSMASLPRHAFARFFESLGDSYFAEKFKDQELYRGYNNYSDFLLATEGDHPRKIGFKDGHDWWKNGRPQKREVTEDYLLHYKPEMVDRAYEEVVHAANGGWSRPNRLRPPQTTRAQVTTVKNEYGRINYELAEDK